MKVTGGESDDREPRLVVFQVELRELCASALVAFAELRVTVAKPPPQDSEGRTFWNRRVWSRLQMILSCASIMSHILWPSAGSHKAPESASKATDRGAALRSLLHLPNEDPLVARRVRNAIEHIDEHLDDLSMARSVDELPLSWVVSSVPREEEPDYVKRAFRYYHVNERIIRVGSASCGLTDVIAWIEDIQDRIPFGGSFVYEFRD